MVFKIFKFVDPYELCRGGVEHSSCSVLAVCIKNGRIMKTVVLGEHWWLGSDARECWGVGSG